jgi:hypothetical protein
MPEHDDFDERLAQRLRAYESRIPAGEIPMADAGPARGRSRLAAAGGVVAFGALAGVLLALVLLNRPAAPTGESSPTPSASSSVTPSASPSATEAAATPSDQASATPTPAGEPYTTVILGDSGSAIAAASGSAGAVVVGYDDAGPAAWHSPDGRNWQRASLPDGAAPDMRLTAVAASDLGYVAVAAHCINECFGGVMWYSADGMTWTDTSTAVTGGILAHLAAGGPGFVAIAIDPFAAGSPSVTPTVLVSDDGQTWESDQPADLLEANVHALGSMGDLLVALGTRNAASGTIATSWMSTDGIGWERHDDVDPNRTAAFEMAGNGQELLAVGQGSCPGGVGLGNECPGEATMAWHSTDGRTWQPALADPCCGGLSDVAATPTGWVAIVTPRDPPFSDAPPALAGRIGEAEWLAVELDAGAELFLQAVTVHDGRALFVGEVRIGDASQPVVIVHHDPLP